MWREIALVAVSGAFALSSAVTRVPADEGPADSGSAVIELFTSQGCSSCPPADRLLAQIASIAEKQNLPIYCLSLHVDYWNSLGWKDPYSDELFTRRQHRYASSFESRRVYTPQMIVNGTEEFVGSRGQDAHQAIKSALATMPRCNVSVTASLAAAKDVVEIEYEVSGHQPGDVLNIAIAQHKVANDVLRGENSGRSLSHVYVVRSLKTVSLDSMTGKISIDFPRGLETGAARVIAYVQNPKSMEIFGAGEARL